MSGRASDADDYLEDYYDAIVLSTGLGSSILAAALAKAGKSVLYLDCHEYYGQDSASFSFTQLLDWAQSNGSDGSSSSSSRAGNADNDTNNSADGNNSGPAGGPSAKASAAPSTRVPFDSATAGTTIARAHVRNELKKERDVAAAAEKAKSVGGDSSSGGPADGDGEDKVTEEEEAETEQGGSNVTAPANGAASDTPASSGQGPTGTNPPEQQNQQPPPQRTEEDQEKGDEEPTAEEKAAQKATEDAAAAVRLRSLDLALLPLSYHGCGTRAGAPSDACVAERRRREAAEEAAAAAGRFLGGRQPQPSHPAWAGRREPSKVEGREGVGAGGVAGEEEGLHPAFWGYRAERRPCAADLVRLSRSFNLDLTSKVMLATGPAVDALVDSGVAKYLEFKDMQALYLASDRSPAGDRVRRPGERELRSASGPGAGNGSRGTSGGGGGGGGINSSQPSAPGSTVSTAAATTRLGLSRVPCSKADVFGTKLLSPLEKRRLMKFLLFASDWGLQRAGEDVLARNEAGLGRGRSLRRPQNREAASGDFGADAYAGKPFAEFLKSCGLPDRVRAMITHALALLPGGGDGGEGMEEGVGGGGRLPGVTTEEGLEAVYRHLSALGRFGETAFITPMYGVGELSQSFCRMAAVHGAICMLRRQLRGAVIDRATGRCVGVVDDAGRAFACSTLVVGGEFFSLSPGATSASNSSENSSENEEQRLRQRPPSPTTATPTTTTAPPPTPPPSTPQSQPLTPPPPLSSTTRLLPPETRPLATPSRLRSRLLRRVVIASGPVAPEGRGRGLCVLPPGLESVGNPAAVHVVSLDESTAACPGNLDGACVIHLTTTTTTASAASAANGEASTPGDSEGGQALSVGDAAQVDCSRKEIEAAAGTGAAAVGGVEAGLDRGPGGVSEDENGREGVLGRAARELLAAAGVEEIWSLGFSWDIQDPPHEDDLPSNMVVCGRLGQELYLQDVVVQAERAFARLCPGKPFWPPPAAVGDEEDDDQAEMLRAAASVVKSAATAPEAVVAAAAAAVAGSEGGGGEERREGGGEKEGDGADEARPEEES